MNTRHYTLLLLAFFMTLGCTQDFEELNTNPNAPNSVQPSLLLRQVLYNTGDELSYEGFVAGDLLSQHRTAIDFNLFDRHALKSPQLGGNPWPILYQNLRDNEIMLQRALNEPTNAIYEGPSRIMKAYLAGQLTDLFGDVPYFEAFNGTNGTVRPAYDAQRDIYLQEGGILDNLDRALEALATYDDVIALEGDILFNGNLESWIRFGNSLKIRHLLRISGREDVAGELQAIFSEGNFISTNDQNAIFNFTNTEPNNFRLAQLRIGDFNNFVLSETMEDLMIGLEDPRIGVLFRPFENASSEAYNGLINGIDASSTSIELAEYSLAGTIFRENTALLDANFMTAWETYFCLAEAAARGLIAADAQQLYETGVQLAFDYWNTPLPAEYLTGPAAYDAPGTEPLQQIITQKWIANTINSYEGWVEYRRTGFPEFRPVQSSLNDGLIPIRMPYPAEEEALNAENYAAAAAATNGNSINVPVWWDE